jgi:peptidoglycan/xylan/chitin deacetylase (PgdA/CDA1 family)/folate-dependent phosphoribosylglycinamide formyltransferase PurN
MEFMNHLDAIAAAGRAPALVSTEFKRADLDIALTFDDGGKSAMFIADTLDKREWKGHFFITTGMIGSRHFVSRADIKELNRRGHVIGSHSHTHPDIFKDLPPESMLAEWRKSRAILEDIIGERIICASIPGGDLNNSAEKVVASEGFLYLFTSEPTMYSWRIGNLTCIGRVCPKAGTPAKKVKRLAQGYGFASEMAVRRLKKVTKTLLYPAYKYITEKHAVPIESAGAAGAKHKAKRLNGLRVVLLVGPRVWHKATCATLIASGANVVGICTADKLTMGVPLTHTIRNVRRRGLLKTLNQILGRLYYLALNAGKDRVALRNIFNESQAEKIIAECGCPIHLTTDYSSAATIKWLRELNPDVFVAHTGYWVGKQVREIPSTKLTIGGHPGITPQYRGSHSTFWALYKGLSNHVGYSVFYLDAGVDTGDLIFQETIPIEKKDSFFTLGWKGMKRIAQAQAEIIKRMDEGDIVAGRPHKEIPAGSEYDVPGLTDYLSYGLSPKIPVNKRE